MPSINKRSQQKGHTYASKLSTNTFRSFYVCISKNTSGENSTGFCFACMRKSSLKQLFCKFCPSSQKNTCSTAHFQHSYKLATMVKMHSFTDVFLEVQRKLVLQSTPSEDCLFITKNTYLEITKRVELKNVQLLVMKKI